MKKESLRKNLLKVFSLFIVVSIATSFVCAQQQHMQQPAQQEIETDFSDNELEKFAEAAQEAQMVQQENQQEMMQAIEDEGITVQEFNQIFEATQNPEVDADITPEQEQAFNTAMQKINELQHEGDESIIEAIEDTGLTFEKYEQIMNAYRQDPEIQERVNQYLH